MVVSTRVESAVGARLLVSSLSNRADRPKAEVPETKEVKERREQGSSIKRAVVVSSQQGPIRSGPKTRVRASTRVAPWYHTLLSGRRASVHSSWLLSSKPKGKWLFCAVGRG